jgi:transposase InsO family protein
VLRRPLESAQYVSVAFTAELIAAGIAGSIGAVGDALDNALCESSIGLFKTEAINLTARPGPTAATSNGRSPAGSTGTTPPGSTPQSGTCPKLSSNSITDRLEPRPPTGRSRKPHTLRRTQGGSLTRGGQRVAVAPEASAIRNLKNAGFKVKTTTQTEDHRASSSAE